MTDEKVLRFEEHRQHLRSVAYRMLGSLAEADDAVQEAWIRYSRTDTSDVDNLGGWFTTVTARVCLNLLKARDRRGEVSLEGRLPDPVVQVQQATDPEQETLLSDAVGMAMMVVLDTLSPAERLSFVLHDFFSVAFDEIAGLTGRSEVAARQLASRARRKIQDAGARPEPDLDRQRRVVGAFFDAARRGDFDALVSTLDPDVVMQADRGPGARFLVRGPKTIARGAMAFADPAAEVRPALVNGAAGVLIVRDNAVDKVMAFTVADGRITRIDSLGDSERLARLELSGQESN